MTTRNCVHSVTDSYFWSRNKDGDHAIWSAVAENPTLHAHFIALHYGCRVIADGIFTLRRSGFVLARRLPLRK